MYKAEFWHHFDVWGNQEDGYDVNEACMLFDDIELEDLEDITLIEKLKELNFLKESASTETIRVEDWHPTLEVIDAKTDFPYGHFYIKE